jgi:hypothetical protein
MIVTAEIINTFTDMIQRSVLKRGFVQLSYRGDMMDGCLIECIREWKHFDEANIDKSYPYFMSVITDTMHSYINNNRNDTVTDAYTHAMKVVQ